jgi:GTP-binding protein
MKIQTTRFIGSFNKISELPKAGIPEFCFIGRSNVGKSSLINYLCSKKDLAKVSSTPGKTQSLNFFLINENWHLVDLPGYGYARRSKSLRNDWEKTMYQYFLERDTLINIFILIDSRIPPQKLDLELIDWFGEHQIPFSIIFTKADKRDLKNSMNNIGLFKTKMQENWEEIPTHFITSSEEKKGKEEVLALIETLVYQSI